MNRPEYRPSRYGILTISVGVTSRAPKHGDGLGEFIAGADAALYVAKAEGRDRVVQRPSVAAHAARAA